MSTTSIISNARMLNDILKPALLHNETTHEVPELTQETPALIQAVNKESVTIRLPGNLIELLNTALSNYYTSDINEWAFSKAYTRRQEYTRHGFMIGYRETELSDRIEFTKKIPTNELNTYLHKYEQLGFKHERQDPLNPRNHETLKSETTYGLELNYETISPRRIQLTISTLVKTRHKNFKKYLI